MSESDKKSVAALLYVTLRRAANRVIDVEWMVRNEEYAREILQLARQQSSDELKHYADRYEEMAFGKSTKPLDQPVASASKAAPIPEKKLMPEIKPENEGGSDELDALPGHYIGTLR